MSQSARRVQAAVAVGLLGVGVGSAAAAPFQASDIVVVQVGDGSAALGGTGTITFLKEYTPGGQLVQTITMPNTPTGGTVPTSGNRSYASTGNATSEQFITLSTNQKILTLGGYNVALGGVTTTGTGNKVIAAVNAAGSVDTTTALTGDATTGNIRSVASDGTSFWETTSANSVKYVSGLGASTPVQLATTLTNTRVSNIFNGQLYTSASSGTNTFKGVNTVGSGTPSTGSQTVTRLPGFTDAAAASSYDFFLASPTVLYVADDSSAPSLDSNTGGGLQKWTFDGTNWNKVYTLNSASGTTFFGLRGLTGNVSGSTATLYATTAESASRLVAITDALATSTTPSTLFTPLATAPTNTAFRGVDFAPIQQIISLTAAAPVVGMGVKITNGAGANQGTFNPNTPVADSLNPTGYPVPTSAVNGISNGTTTGVSADYVQESGLASTDAHAYWLKLDLGAADFDPSVQGQAIYDSDLNQLIADINAAAGHTGGIVASRADADPSTALYPGYDLLITEAPLGGGGPNSEFLGFNLANETSVPGFAVTDITAVPEPAGASVALVGCAMALIHRRRRAR
jgi:hypothetical protein